MLRAFPALHAQAQGQDTHLRGAVADQAALHGVLAQIEALGLELLEVRRLPREPRTSRDQPTRDAQCRPQTTKHLDADDEQTSEARLPMNHNAKDQTTLTCLPPAVQV